MEPTDHTWSCVVWASIREAQSCLGVRQLLAIVERRRNLQLHLFNWLVAGFLSEVETYSKSPFPWIWKFASGMLDVFWITGVFPSPLNIDWNWSISVLLLGCFLSFSDHTIHLEMLFNRAYWPSDKSYLSLSITVIDNIVHWQPTSSLSDHIFAPWSTGTVASSAGEEE